jgi:hypothetical protein
LEWWIVSRRVLLILIGVWIGLHLVWLLTWLLGVAHPLPRILGGVIGVLDIIVVGIVIVYLVRSSFRPMPTEDEETKQERYDVPED